MTNNLWSSGGGIIVGSKVIESQGETKKLIIGQEGVDIYNNEALEDLVISINREDLIEIIKIMESIDELDLKGGE